jgi:hypothetical protein
MSIRSSHAASWHSDKWYRRAWYIWPQAISLLLVGWLFAGALLQPVPWAQPKTQAPSGAKAPPTAPWEQPSPGDTDEIICSLDLRYSRNAILNACGRVIGKGAVWPYFMRARVYVWNEDYYRAIEDFSAFIRRTPDSDEALNERGWVYAIKGDYDRAIADYTEAIRLNREPVEPYLNRGSAYEKKGELDKALADFREALSHGSAAMGRSISEDIKRIEGAIASLLSNTPVRLAGGHYEMPGYRWVSDDIQVGGKPYTRIGLVWVPVEQKSVTPVDAQLPSKYVVDGLEGISLGARVSFESSDYQEYQCKPSEQFEGVTWCNKQRVVEEARGSYRSSYTIAHSRDGTIYYLNRFLEPAFFNAGEVDNDIERLSGKFGEPITQRFAMPGRVADVDGLIATWGKVTLEPLDSTAIDEWVAGRNPPKGILIDFIGSFSNSVRSGLPIYRVSGGPGFVRAASFDPEGRGTVRFFAIDPSALLPGTAKESTAPTQNDCDRLAANPSDRRKPPLIPGVPYDILTNQAKDAIAACTLAVQQSPTELRYQYQMARAMETEAPEKAFEIHNKLAHLGYPVAYDNLGWLEIKLHKNFGEAVKDFEAGSQLQDPGSIVSLVEMIDKGYVPTDRPQELKDQLLRRAADLGHQGAQLQIEGEYEKKRK